MQLTTGEKMKTAIGYIRVSGKGQINGDGFTRQELAIKEYATANGIEVTRIYKESGVSGTLSNRPTLTNMMVDIEHDDTNLIIIERIDRLARDLMIQETILDEMKKKKVKLISVTDGDLLEDAPTRILVRQVLGAIAEYDKAMIVHKLRVARNRKKSENGKCEGRKSYNEINPELMKEIKRLRRKPRNGKRLSLKSTVESLNESGYVTATGNTFTVSILKNIIYRDTGNGKSTGKS